MENPAGLLDQLPASLTTSFGGLSQLHVAACLSPNCCYPNATPRVPELTKAERCTCKIGYTRLHTATGYENMLYNQAAKQRFYATDNPDLGLPWTAQQLCPIQDKRCSFQSEFWFRLT